tara:strand:- start:1958 stop:2554 length:597 start_codon:yes stop_codon:yes gene_type:complete
LKNYISNNIIYNYRGLNYSYIENFYDKDKSSYYLDLLLNKVVWHQEQINIYGKSIDLPRLTAYYSDPGIDYSYSGIRHKSAEYPSFINSIKLKVETFFDANFNSVLLNRYNDGSQWHGYHSDNEKELGDMINICSISFGASRDFIFKSKKSKLKKNLILQNGSALYMMHPTQNNYNHSLPKRTKITDERVNLTFRYVI